MEKPNNLPSSSIEQAINQKREYLTKNKHEDTLKEFNKQLETLMPELQKLPEDQQKQIADRVKNFQISEKRKEGTVHDAVKKLIASLSSVSSNEVDVNTHGDEDNDAAMAWDTPGFERPHSETLGKNNQYGLPEGTEVTYMGDVGKPSQEHIEKTKGATVPSLIVEEAKSFGFPLVNSDMFLPGPEVGNAQNFMARWLVYGEDGLKFIDNLIHKMMEKEQRPEVRNRLQEVMDANKRFLVHSPMATFSKLLSKDTPLSQEQKTALFSVLNKPQVSVSTFEAEFQRITGRALNFSSFFNDLRNTMPLNNIELEVRNNEPLNNKEINGRLNAESLKMDSYFQEVMRYLIKVIPGNKKADVRGSMLGAMIWTGQSPNNKLGTDGDPTYFQSFSSPEEAQASMKQSVGVDFWSASNSPTKADVDLFNKYYS